MSTNTEIAKIFEEMAAVLTLTDANPFRISAHEKVARTLRDLSTDVKTLADDKKKLMDIPGVGKASADKIIEYVTTGQVAEHQELLHVVPPTLLQLFRIPGLGPKTVKMLWDKCGVTDIESLKQAIDEGKLDCLPRMGAKSIEKIKEGIAFAAQSTERIRLGSAMPIAEMIIEELKKAKHVGIQQIQFAGSLRRGAETIGDIDILASTTKPKELANAFTTLPQVESILASGATKCSVRLGHGVQVDLRIIDDSAFGAALMYFTGSKAHNVKLREMAIKKKMRLNEYGLFPDDGKEGAPQTRGVKPAAAKTEQDIYKKLGLPWIPPELREDRGEIGADIPELITFDDIKAELHAHTTASDGRLTIEELILEAKARGFHTIAITDHSKSSVQANGLSVERLLKHIDAIREAAARFKSMNVLAGAEVDILTDGRLDYDDEILAKLDIVIASPHAALTQDDTKATERLLKAVTHPLVHILGHPTGRMINKREGLHPDLNAIIAAAVEHDTALEINSNHVRLDLRDTHVHAAVLAGAKIAINTDAHTRRDFDELRYGILTGRRGWLTAEQCINTWTKTKLANWIKSKRTGKTETSKSQRSKSQRRRRVNSTTDPD